MRRLLFLAMLLPAACWLLWASCQADDYRDTLPLRSFDAAPREAGPASPPDLTAAADLAKPDQGTSGDGGAGDAGPGPGDGGAGPGDGGAGDAGPGDGAAGD